MAVLRDPELVACVARTLVRFLPDMAERHAKFQAGPIVESIGDASFLHHHGRADVVALGKIGKAIAEIQKQREVMSQNAELALWNTVHNYGLRPDERQFSELLVNGDRASIPWWPEEFDLTMQVWSIGVNRAALAIADQKPGHGINTKAVIVVDGAQKIWNNYAKQPAPQKKLNPTSPFARFLEQLFDDLSVGATPESGFNAWVRELNNPDSMLYDPDSGV